MKRVFLFFLITLMFVYLAACGGSGNGPVQLTGTPMTLQTGDAANDQIAKFELTISSVILTGASGTPDTANLLSGSAEVEFSHQAGAFEPLTLAHVPPAPSGVPQDGTDRCRRARTRSNGTRGRGSVICGLRVESIWCRSFPKSPCEGGPSCVSVIAGSA